MLISCPRCNSVYIVDAKQVPESGKRFKCAECGKIWTVTPKDLFEAEPEKRKFKTQKVRPASEFDSDNENVRKMFEMLDRDTKGLFDSAPEQYTSNEEINKIIRHLRIRISPLMVNGAIMIVILILSAFIAYFDRYDVVRIIPRMQYFYDKFDIDCIYYGRDLKFTEVATKHITKKGKHYIEAHGVIANEGNYKSEVPPIKAVVSTVSGEPLVELVKNPVIPSVDAHFSSLFRILIESTDNEAKLLELSFLSREEQAQRAEEAMANNDAKAVDKNQGKRKRFDLNARKSEQIDKF